MESNKVIPFNNVGVLNSPATNLSDQELADIFTQAVDKATDTEVSIEKDVDITAEEILEVDEALTNHEIKNARYHKILGLKKLYSNQLVELDDVHQLIENYEAVRKMSDMMDSLGEVPKDLSLKLSNDVEVNLNEFKTTYYSDRRKLAYAISELDKIAGTFESQIHSTVFLTAELTASYTERFDKELEMNPILSPNQIRLRANITTALDKRQEIDYILTKYNANDPKFVTWMKRYHKNYKISEQKRVVKVFTNLIDANHVALLHGILNERYGSDMFSISLLAFFAEKIKSGLKDGSFLYYKLFIMNLLDIYIKNYDLEKGADYFMDQIDILYNVYSVHLLPKL